MTPSEVSRGYGLSILFRRWLATWIDFVVVIAMLFAVGTLNGPLAWVAVAAYFTVLEGVWGLTLGKLVASTRVVDASGAAPGLPKALVRTLLRVIEVNPFFFGGLPAAIVAAVTRDNQRLGDLATDTFVLKCGDLTQSPARGRGASPPEPGASEGPGERDLPLRTAPGAPLRADLPK